MHFHSNSLQAKLSPFNLSHTMFNVNKKETCRAAEFTGGRRHSVVNIWPAPQQ